MNKIYGTYNESPEGKAARFKAWAADNKEHLRNYKKTKEKLYRNPLNNKYMCDLNTREGKAQYMKLWAADHKEHLNAYREKNREHIKEVQKENRVRTWKETHLWQQEHKQKLRLICLEAYGGSPPKCACCGETELNFLALDHIRGKGNEYRRELRNKGHMLYPHLIKENFPEGFRVLCHNCNMSMGFYGYCPHQKAKS